MTMTYNFDSRGVFLQQGLVDDSPLPFMSAVARAVCVHETQSCAATHNASLLLAANGTLSIALYSCCTAGGVAPTSSAGTAATG